MNGSVRLQNVTDLRSEARPDGSVAIFLTEGDDPSAGRGTVVPGQPVDDNGVGEKYTAAINSKSSVASRTCSEIESLFGKARLPSPNLLQWQL